MSIGFVKKINWKFLEGRPGEKLAEFASLSVVDFSIYYIGDGFKTIVLVEFPVGAGVGDFYHFESAPGLFSAVEFYIVDKSFVSAFNCPFLFVGSDFVEDFESFREVKPPYSLFNTIFILKSPFFW